MYYDSSLAPPRVSEAETALVSEDEAPPARRRSVALKAAALAAALLALAALVGGSSATTLAGSSRADAAAGAPAPAPQLARLSDDGGTTNTSSWGGAFSPSPSHASVVRGLDITRLPSLPSLTPNNADDDDRPAKRQSRVQPRAGPR